MISLGRLSVQAEKTVSSVINPKTDFVRSCGFKAVIPYGSPTLSVCKRNTKFVAFPPPEIIGFFGFRAVRLV